MSDSATGARAAAGQDGASSISYLRYASSLLDHLRRYYKLLLILGFFYACVGVAIAVFVQPEFTAVAILGQAPSPLDDLTGLTSKLGGALGSGITKKLGLSGGGGNGDLFDQYVELLNSYRLAQKLTQNEAILRAIFPRRFDWRQHRWRKQDGIFVTIKNALKTLVHYPVRTVPDADDVAKYLKHNITVDAPLTSSFVTVSLRSESPQKAAWILNTLLLDADTIIRNDRRRDVGARIAYLSQILPTVTQADQRQSLSEILSDQQQSMMMIHADQRYASALVDPPHASLIPTFPNLLTIVGSMALLAVVSWGVIVFIFPEGHWIFHVSSLSHRKHRPNTRPDREQSGSSRIRRKFLMGID